MIIDWDSMYDHSLEDVYVDNDIPLYPWHMSRMRSSRNANGRSIPVLYLGADETTFARLQLDLSGTPHFSLTQASTIEYALYSLQQTPVSVILFDLSAPVGKALETLTDVRQGHPNTPIIFLAGDAEAETAVRLTEDHNQDYILKNTADWRLLKRAVSRASNQQRLQTELALINHVSRQLTSTLDLNVVLKTTLEEVRRLLDVMACSIWLIDENRDELVCRQVVGPGSEQIREWRLDKNQGIVGWVATHSLPLLIRDTWTDPRHYTQIDQTTGLPIRSTLCLPLLTKQRTLGTLQLVDSEADSFTKDDQALLESIAASAAIAIENAQLFTHTQNELAERAQVENALRNRNQELARLYRISDALLTGASSLESLGELIVTTVQHEFEKTNCSLVLVRSDSDSLNRVAVVGPYAAAVVQTQLTLHGAGLIPLVIRNGRLLNVADVRTQAEYTPGWSDARSELVVPLKIGQQVLGALDVQSAELSAFTDEDERLLLHFADRAAMAVQSMGLTLETIRLYDKLRAHTDELEIHVATRTEELHLANARLTQALQARDEFLASMSHELRTPLNAILLRCELISELDSPTPNQVRSIGIIEESARQLLEIVNDMLDVAKIEAGKLELVIEAVPVQPICESSLQMVQRSAAQKQITIHQQIEETAVYLHADGRRLRQILVNLLSNAVKFTPEGGAVGLQVYGDAAHSLLHFTVWDTGIGIPKEQMARLFQPFSQIDSSLARKYSGAGLGLALVQRLVRLHHGLVHLESEMGQGSRFTISLPWSVAGNQNVVIKDRETAVRGPLLPFSANGVNHAIGGATILLAEDNEATTEALAEFLSLQGYEVLTARNGREALQLAQQEQPDLILMDIQMPDVNGLEAIKQIRALAAQANHPTTRPIAIVAVTALVMNGDRERCLEAGADVYISKPLSFEYLNQVIEGLLSSS